MRAPAAVFTIFLILTLSSATLCAQSAPPPESIPQTAQPIQPTQAQTPEQIAASLEKHTVVLRNFYTDASLTFDAQGKLVSAGTPGFGATDGRIYIEKSEIKNTAIVISGVRPVLVWHAATSDFQMTNTGLAVEVQINLDPAKLDTQAVASVLNHVFVRHSELQDQECPANSDKVHRIMGPPLRKSSDKKKPRLFRTPPDSLCFASREANRPTE